MIASKTKLWLAIAPKSCLCSGNGAAQPSAASGFLHSIEARDCDQINQLVTGGEAVYVQTGRGEFNGAIRRLRLGSLTLLQTVCPNKTVVRVVTERDKHYAFIPLKSAETMSWNGRDQLNPGVFSWDGQFGFFRRGMDTEMVSLIYDGNSYAASRSAWLGIEPGVMPPRHEGRNAPARLSGAFHGLLQQVLGMMISEPQAFQMPGFRQTIEESITKALLLAEHGEGGNGRLSAASRLGRADIVHQADEYLHGRLGQPVYLLELCRALGVNARTLNYAFHDVCGMSPLQYLKLRRLRLVRQILRNGIHAGGSVKAAALQCGFADLGRFSIEYRRFFGESPSQTLEGGLRR